MATDTRKKYVVEHMEDGFYPWVLLEYQAISADVGGSGQFFLTSLKPELASSLPEALSRPGIVTTTTEEVIALAGVSESAKQGRVCLLDPAAEVDLSPADAEQFDWFVFGGILGDHPPRDRTGELRRYGFTGRRLGDKQMTTDTAIRVTQIIAEKRVALDEIPFVDFPELRFSKHSSTEMPFRYVRDEQGEPIMPKGMKELIKEDSKRGIEDLL
ncbi:SAM-dependent RNA methyltransferase [Lipomyces oligophaga]|uniref:SAM-dependent RNA methyltransferase n=1 Tax=Lipomyces oligophaga TaxID=45792 RepID=UPI0034CE7CBC